MTHPRTCVRERSGTHLRGTVNEEVVGGGFTVSQESNIFLWLSIKSALLPH